MHNIFQSLLVGTNDKKCGHSNLNTILLRQFFFDFAFMSNDDIFKLVKEKFVQLIQRF